MSADHFVPGNVAYQDIWTVRFDSKSTMLAGTLYVDADNDAIVDVDDPRIGGRLVELNSNAELTLSQPNGRYLFAVGRNETAARYSGINANLVTASAYVLCGLLAGIAGVLLAFYTNSVSPSSHGNFYELYGIAAAVLGGCSLRGGEGNIIGVIIGAAVMRLIYNSINLLGIPSMLEYVVIGLVILFGVIADELSRKIAAYRRARQQAAVASKS